MLTGLVSFRCSPESVAALFRGAVGARRTFVCAAAVLRHAALRGSASTMSDHKACSAVQLQPATTSSCRACLWTSCSAAGCRAQCAILGVPVGACHTAFRLYNPSSKSAEQQQPQELSPELLMPW